MKTTYTKEQAEQVLRDYNNMFCFHKDLDENDKDFLNHKFPSLEVGQWVTFAENPAHVGFITKIDGDRYFYYGLNSAGVWVEDDWYSLTDVSKPRPATDKEVEKSLIAEAKRRGLWDVPVICCNGKKWNFKNKISGFLVTNNKLWSTYGPVFHNGKWSEIVDPTKDKIAELEATINKAQQELKELKGLVD